MTKLEPEPRHTYVLRCRRRILFLDIYVCSYRVAVFDDKNMCENRSPQSRSHQIFTHKYLQLLCLLVLGQSERTLCSANDSGLSRDVVFIRQSGTEERPCKEIDASSLIGKTQNVTVHFQYRICTETSLMSSTVFPPSTHHPQQNATISLTMIALMYSAWHGSSSI